MAVLRRRFELKLPPGYADVPNKEALSLTQASIHIPMDGKSRKHGPSFAQQHEVLTDLTSRLLLTRDVVRILSLVTEATHHMLGYEDCVIYLRQNERLTQWVASGPKQNANGSVNNPLVLSINQGIVGAAARSGVTQLVNDTASDPRYVTDDMFRGSEMAVPICSGGIAIAVIDSEHSETHFYTERDAEMLECIAAVVALPLNQALHGYTSTEHREHDIALANSALDSLSSTDDMTGILNRRAFTKRLEYAEQNKESLCCAVFDMDGFKQINDNYGHHVGDNAILAFVSLLRDAFPHGGSARVLARLGGDEFGVLCTLDDCDDFIARVETVLSGLTAVCLYQNETRIHFSGSAGVAFGHADTVWLRADEALYISKANGKNGVVVANVEPLRLAS